MKKIDKTEGRKLLSWANCWMENRYTGDIIPAYYNDQIDIYFGQNDKPLDKSWVPYTTPKQESNFNVAVAFFLAVLIIVGFYAFR